MKRLFFLITFLIAICVAACKKNDNKTQQYSKWYVGVDSFSTSNVRVDIGKVVASLVCNQLSPNSFSLHFNTGHLPVSGYFKASCATQNPADVCIGIGYKGLGYESHFATQTLLATTVNGKARYTLAPTWLLNSSNFKDSVLVSGVFNEP